MRPSLLPASAKSRKLCEVAVVIAALAFTHASITRALPLENPKLVYSEDFQGEFALPNQPNVDEYDLGGLSGFTFSSPPVPGGPDLQLGTRARFNLEGSLGIFAQILLTSAAPGDFGFESIGLRARFENLLLSALNGQAAAGIAARYPSSGPDIQDTTLAGILLISDSGSVAPTLELCLNDYEFSASGIGESPPALTCVPISEGATNDILGGAPFTIDVHVNQSLRAAQASLDVAGVEVSATPLTPLIRVAPGEVQAVASSVGSFLTLADPLSLSLDLLELEIYHAYDHHFLVDTNLDAVDTIPGDGLCLTASANCSLRAAIQESNALPGSADIHLINPGSHDLSIAGSDEDAAATGDLDLLGDVRIRGLGASLTTAGTAIRFPTAISARSRFPSPSSRRSF